jgi:hypothetical protein
MAVSHNPVLTSGNFVRFMLAMSDVRKESLGDLLKATLRVRPQIGLAHLVCPGQI